MKCFEVELEGFRGDTDATDGRILWGTASDLEQVRDSFPRGKVREIETLYAPEDIDFALPEIM